MNCFNMPIMFVLACIEYVGITNKLLKMHAYYTVNLNQASYVIVYHRTGTIFTFHCNIHCSNRSLFHSNGVYYVEICQVAN